MNPVFLLVEIDICFKHHFRRVIGFNAVFLRSMMYLILRNDSVNIAIISRDRGYLVAKHKTSLYLSVTVFSKAVDQRYGFEERSPCFATFCQMLSMLLVIIK